VTHCWRHPEKYLKTKKENRMAGYKYHKDWTNGKWNIFQVVNGREEYFKTVDTLAEAQQFCSINNWRPQ